jgi:hypothetical protein
VPYEKTRRRRDPQARRGEGFKIVGGGRSPSIRTPTRASRSTSSTRRTRHADDRVPAIRTSCRASKYAKQYDIKVAIHNHGTETNTSRRPTTC